MSDIEQYEKFLSLILNAIGILSGHFEDILNIVHAFEEDPASVNLDELEVKISNLRPLPEV